MPTPNEWITVQVGRTVADLSTATIEACDDTLRKLAIMRVGLFGGIGAALDETMYRAWCDVVLDRRLTLAREVGPLV